MLERAEIVQALAQMVVNTNIQCFKEVMADEELAPTEEAFRSFGVDGDTVKFVLRDIMEDVLPVVESLQRTIAPHIATIIK